MERLIAFSEGIQARYHALSRRTKLALAAWLVLQVIIFGSASWYGPKRLFENLAAWANQLRESKWGWTLLLGLIILSSFPPLFGYTTACTLCGFTFGLVNGFLLALAGTVCGSMLSFLLARLILSTYAKKMMENQTALKALGSAVVSYPVFDFGLPLIALIRLCPFPYAYSNFFFATIREVSLFQFFVATCGLSIKLILHVYIGTRIYLFSDPDHLNEMDKTSKILNSIAVALGILLGIGVGIYVYRLTMRYVGEGQVALIEEDLERFLDEEDIESQIGASREPSPMPNGSSSNTDTYSRLQVLEPNSETEPRASMNWDTALVDVYDSTGQSGEDSTKTKRDPRSS